MSVQQLSQTSLPPGSQEDRSGPYRVFLIFLTVLVTAALALRFWSRSLGARQVPGGSLHRFWWDDWVALLATCIIWVFFGLAFAEHHLGFGRHIWMVPQQNLPKVFKLLYAIYFLFDISLFLTKTSALLFLRRVFPRHATSNLWNYALYTAHGLNIAWLIGIIFGTVFMCDPVQKGWNPMLPGKCGTTSALWIGSAVPSVFIDLVILLLPVPPILPLHISRARKAGVLLVFVLGYIVIVVSLGRTITVTKSAQALNEDITYEGMPMVYWVTCEAPTTLVSICLPAMINLINRLHDSFLSPLSSKISSIWSTYTSTDSFFKSRDGAFNTTLNRSREGEAQLDFASNYSNTSITVGDKTIHSVEGQSVKGNNNIQASTSIYQEDIQIPLSNITGRQNQYLTSIESGGRAHINNHSTTPG